MRRNRQEGLPWQILLVFYLRRQRLVLRKSKQNSHGLTLIEVVIALAVMAAATFGSLVYEYHATRHARIAAAEIAAKNIAHLLVDDWKSTGGVETYDPVSLNLGISSTTEDGYDYTTTADGIYLFVNLSYQDIDSDAETGTTLREIQVRVRWRNDFGPGSITNDAPSIVLTTYVRRDQSNG